VRSAGDLAGTAVELAAAAGRTPLLLVDYTEAALEGGRLLRELLASEPGQAGRTVLLAGVSEQGGARQLVRDLGLLGSLAKPVHPGQLFALVGEQRQPAVVDAAPLAPRPAIPTPLAARTGVRVLLAEDNVVNRRLACRVLEKAGHRVLQVQNGREALAMLEREPVDLVLMDVQMPELDGFAATRELRRREQTTGRHLPVLALTAHAMSGDEERCLAAGMDGYVVKPFKAEILLARIKELVTAVPAVITEPLLQVSGATGANGIEERGGRR
jgi:CheY-like chemotaxis protein